MRPKECRMPKTAIKELKRRIHNLKPNQSLSEIYNLNTVKEEITRQTLINDPEIRQLGLMERTEQFYLRNNIPFTKYMHVLGFFDWRHKE